jgi:hypothetical protein
MGRHHPAAGRPALGPARADHEDHVLVAHSLIVDERYDPRKPPGYVVALTRPVARSTSLQRWAEALDGRREKLIDPCGARGFPRAHEECTGRLRWRQLQ